MGMNWTEEDLAKPQILVDSAHGMGHPGTFHFRPLIEEVSNGVFEAGGKPGVFTVSDICDGVAQAHAGMSYSLVSRDIMAAMVEIHALGHPHDGMVLISGNDKSVPAHLLEIGRASCRERVDCWTGSSAIRQPTLNNGTPRTAQR